MRTLTKNMANNKYSTTITNIVTMFRGLLMTLPEMKFSDNYWRISSPENEFSKSKIYKNTLSIIASPRYSNFIYCDCDAFQVYQIEFSVWSNSLVIYIWDDNKSNYDTVISLDYDISEDNFFQKSLVKDLSFVKYEELSLIKEMFDLIFKYTNQVPIQHNSTET